MQITPSMVCCVLIKEFQEHLDVRTSLNTVVTVHSGALVTVTHQLIAPETYFRGALDII